jgi:hypothetical protein
MDLSKLICIFASRCNVDNYEFFVLARLRIEHLARLRASITENHVPYSLDSGAWACSGNRDLGSALIGQQFCNFSWGQTVSAFSLQFWRWFHVYRITSFLGACACMRSCAYMRNLGACAYMRAIWAKSFSQKTHYFAYRRMHIKTGNTV